MALRSSGPTDKSERYPVPNYYSISSFKQICIYVVVKAPCYCSTFKVGLKFRLRCQVFRTHCAESGNSLHPFSTQVAELMLLLMLL